jgi:hypothetical protein
MRARTFVIAVGFLIVAGCSQSIDQVSITARNPEPSSSIFVGDVDHQGGNSQPAVSASAILSEQALGGSLMRTNSSSPSFKLNSGIGVH